MNSLYQVVVVVQVLSALIIVGLVLLQHGKGADMGAAFGSGASGSLFGATGSSNFLSKSTGIAAAVFFSATLTLAYLGNAQNATVSSSVVDKVNVTTPATPTKPAASAPAASAPAAASAAGSAASGQAGQIPK